jgi:iron complex transport system permease protein
MIRPVVLLLLATVCALFAALAFGDVGIPAADLLRLLATGEGSPQAAMIVLDFRLPRALLAFEVGMALSVAGAIAQTTMRNPLAEPSLLGITAGAALAAMVLIVLADDAHGHLLPWLSFAGAAGMALAIWILSWRNGTSSMRIILIGIGLTTLAGAATTFLSAIGDIRDVQRALIWMAGSVYDSSWSKLQVLFAWSALPLGLAWMSARELDLLGFGDHTSRALGQRVNLMRGLMVLLCAALSGAAVAAAGLIGFVGLIGPHLARRMVGPRHGALIPAAALLGGLLVMVADLVGRTVIAPQQLPAGLMTALIGAPFFAYLMWDRRNVRA